MAATETNLPRRKWPEFEAGLAAIGVRYPDWSDGDGTTTGCRWDAGLSASEGAKVTDLIAALRMGVDYDVYVQIKPFLPTVKSWVSRTGTPTNAQVIAMIDALTGVVRALVKDTA